jgi:hypothetical protein
MSFVEWVYAAVATIPFSVIVDRRWAGPALTVPGLTMPSRFKNDNRLADANPIRGAPAG